MKKLFLVMTIAAFAVCAKAQFYAGGTVGFMSVDNGDKTTYCKILPELGYNVNDQVSVGAIFGYTRNWASSIANNEFGETARHGYTFQPYVRYQFLKSGMFSFYGEGDLGYTKFKDNGEQYTVGVRPVITFNITDKISLVSKIGFLGYNCFSPKDDDKDDTKAWGFDVNGNNIEFGLFYNF